MGVRDMTSAALLTALLMQTPDMPGHVTHRDLAEDCVWAFEQAVQHRPPAGTPDEFATRIGYAIHECNDLRLRWHWRDAGIERTLGHAQYLAGNYQLAILAYRR